jgi:WhiB family redox-sensing transcriptional regulator
MAQALCRMLPPSEVDDMFFPVNGRSNKAKREYQKRVTGAKNICAACPVREQCEQYRASLQAEHGVWGGRDELDRDPVRRRKPAGTLAGTLHKPAHKLHSVRERAST